MSQIVYAIAQGPRDNIEDAAGAIAIECQGVGISQRLPIFAVLDGVGGENHGEVASECGLRSIMKFLAGWLAFFLHANGRSPLAPDACLQAMARAVLYANTHIRHQIQKNPELKGMASTVVAGFIYREVLFLVWAGDSRCYLCRDGAIQLLTHDHSDAQRLVDQGLLTEEQAEHHLLAHTVYNYLGKPDIRPETRAIRLRQGDVLLLCSDGLSDVLNADVILQQVEQYQLGSLPFSALPDQLITEALAADTGDNVTALLLEHTAADTVTERISKTLRGDYTAAVAQSLIPLNKE